MPPSIRKITLLITAIVAPLAGPPRVSAEINRVAGDLSLKLEVERAIVEHVLEDLIRDRLLEEDRFVESFIRGRVRKGQGPVRIRGELAQRGIADTSASSALNEADCDWIALAVEVRVKRFGAEAPVDFKERARQAKFLQYRGFESEQIRAALDAARDSD